MFACSAEVARGFRISDIDVRYQTNSAPDIERRAAAQDPAPRRRLDQHLGTSILKYQLLHVRRNWEGQRASLRPAACSSAVPQPPLLSTTTTGA